MQERDDYNQRFEAIINRFEGKQRAAVMHLEGPVMVVAGPGTGKTELLAARIGQILIQTDTSSHNILCLTYTDAGVKAMRERLISFIGPEAYKLHIHTYHSFCNMVLQENAELFSLQEAEPITDLERVEIIEGILRRLPPEHPLRTLRGEKIQYLSNLKNLFSTMKSEGWSYETIETACQEYLTDLPKREKYIYKRKSGNNQQGDLKQHLIDAEVERIRKTLAAAALFDTYVAKLKEKNRYEFEDMLTEVRRGFQFNARLLRRYQEQYLYVLVDEFQDTNPVQMEILERLLEYWETPNVFVVGDDDQTVYGFQGARIQNITDFKARHTPALNTFVLDQNFRSSQPILDAAERLIARNKQRLINTIGGQKHLEATRKETALPELHIYSNALYEAIGIADRIEALHEAGTAYGEVAVIYAKHRQANYLKEVLRERGIPYQTRQAANALDEPTVTYLLRILQYVADERRAPYTAEHRLFEILHFPCFALPHRDLARLGYALRVRRAAAIANAQTDDDTATNEYSNTAVSWLDILADTTLHDELLLTNSEGLVAVGAYLEAWLETYGRVPLPVFARTVMHQSGMLRYVAAHPDRLPMTQALWSFYEWIRAQTLSTPTFDVYELTEAVARMQANKLPLPTQAALVMPDTVTLTTAHSAKGLQFDNVFMIDCCDDWGVETRASSQKFTLPDTLTRSGEEADEEAKRRLFYVAITRAKYGLFLSYGNKIVNEDKARTPVLFLTELISDGSLITKTKEILPDMVVSTQLALMSKPKDATPTTLEPHLSSMEMELLLTDYALSASGFNKYLNCHLAFYYEDVLKLPVAPNSYMIFGNAIHFALKRVFERARKAKPVAFPPLEAVLEDFETDLTRHKHELTPNEYTNTLALGNKVLPDYYTLRVTAWSEGYEGEALTERINNAEVERAIRGVEWEGIPLQGRIDRFEATEHLVGYVHITDYKTAAYDPKKLTPPNVQPTAKNNTDTYGGTYWRQLAFYKLLVDNYRTRDYAVRTAEIDYVIPDDKGAYHRQSISFPAGEYEVFRQTVRSVWAGITAHDFFTGCGKADCKWCRFTETYTNETNFRSSVDEEMDE